MTFNFYVYKHYAFFPVVDCAAVSFGYFILEWVDRTGQVVQCRLPVSSPFQHHLTGILGFTPIYRFKN
jgi:hypothetical protein